jgi:hypothetical protein
VRRSLFVSTLYISHDGRYLAGQQRESHSRSAAAAQQKQLNRRCADSFVAFATCSFVDVRTRDWRFSGCKLIKSYKRELAVFLGLDY